MIASCRVSSGITERPIRGRMRYPPARSGIRRRADISIGIRGGPRVWVESSGTLKSTSARARRPWRRTARPDASASLCLLQALRSAIDDRLSEGALAWRQRSGAVGPTQADRTVLDLGGELGRV